MCKIENDSIIGISINEIIKSVINSDEFINRNISSNHYKKPDDIKLKIKTINYVSDDDCRNPIRVGNANNKLLCDYKGNSYYDSGSDGVYDVYFDYEVIYNDSNYWKNLGGFENHINKSEYFRIFKNEVISITRDVKIRSLNITMSDKIINRLTEYLGFDSNDIFIKGNLVRVFGGAIRDIINDDPINDIDILCGSKSYKMVENILLNNGYKYMESLTPKDLSSIYTDIKVINEPHSWIKGDKIVQIIRPSVAQFNIEQNGLYKSTSEIYEKSFIELISNVDISCCGVSFDGDNLYENYPDAINHILNKAFIVNEMAKMYNYKRIEHRKHKFLERGWSEINPNKLEDVRDLRIKSVLNNFNDFITEHRFVLDVNRNGKTFQ